MQLLDRYPGSFEISRRLVSVQIDNHELAEAIETLHRAKLVSEKEELEFKVVEASILFRQSRHKETIALALETLPRISAQHMARQELTLLEVLAKATENLGQLETSRGYSLRALDLSRELQSQKFEAQATGLVADIARQQHQFTRAFELLDLRAARLADEGDTRSIRQLSITRAELLLATGQPAQAEALLSTEALPHMREDTNTYWEGYALIVRSEARRSMAKLDAALEDCHSAEAVFRGKSARQVAYAQLTCGQALLDAGQTSDAAKLVEKSRTARTKLGPDTSGSRTRWSRPRFLLAERDARAPCASLRRCWQNTSEHDNPMKQVFTRELMARAALAMGDVDRAESALAPALKIGPGEHRELDLQLRLTTLRLQRVRGDDIASSAAIQALRNEALGLGYARLANLATEALPKSPL